MIAAWAVLIALAGHWVFDFVCQPNWMAIRKSKEWWVLLQHAMVITVGALVTAVVIVIVASNGRPEWIGIWALVQGATHFAIDAVTSRITGRLWQNERRHAFFVVVGLDQLLHTSIAVVSLLTLAAWT